MFCRIACWFPVSKFVGFQRSAFIRSCAMLESAYVEYSTKQFRKSEILLHKTRNKEGFGSLVSKEGELVGWFRMIQTHTALPLKAWGVLI
jgi:hypothetical protein